MEENGSNVQYIVNVWNLQYPWQVMGGERHTSNIKEKTMQKSGKKAYFLVALSKRMVPVYLS